MNPVIIKLGDTVRLKDSPYDSMVNGDILTVDFISHNTFYLLNKNGFCAPFYKHEFEVINEA